MFQKFSEKKTIKFILSAAICLLLVFLNPKGFFTPVRNFFLIAAYPFQKTFYLAGKSISGTFEFLGSISDLKNEDEKLLKENNSLAAEVAMLKEEKNENAMLRKQLELLPRQKFDLEASFVIGQNPQKIGSWIMIDKGASRGLETGMPAIVSDGIVVGKISERGIASSKITLLSDSESALNVMDLETGSRGILRGEYGLGIVMDLVSQTDILNAGDTIVTSGLGSDMPKGLLVGKIQEVRLNGDKLFQQAIVVPSVKYSKLDTVFVIKNIKNSN